MEVGRTLKREVVVAMGNKENNLGFQKKKHDLVTNWIQMIKEIGDLNFSF